MTLRILRAAMMLIMFDGVALADPIRLITEEEAKRPPLAVSPKRAITRGPEIHVESPVSGSTVTSPVRIKVAFKAHGGVKISPDSVEIRYLRNRPVMLTSRVRPFIKPTGFTIDEALVPVGEHDIEIVVHDDDEREAAVTFRLIVQP